VTRAAAVQRLPAADDRVDIGGVELQPVTPPAGALGGDHRCAAAEKGVEYNLAAGRAVEDGVGDHRHWFHGRVQRQQIALLAATGEGIGARVVPHIAAVAPEPTELNVIAVILAAVFENGDKLVPAPIERAHPGIVLDPDAEVFELAVYPAADGEQVFAMALVHEQDMQQAIDAAGCDVATG